MPKMHLREILSGNLIPNVPGNNSVCFGQKRINLPEGKRFRIKSVQCFDDNAVIETSPDRGPENQLTMRLVYVTPYPIVLTKEAWGPIAEMKNLTKLTGLLNSMGPYAGDNSVLYKRIDISNCGNDESWNMIDQGSWEFPNPQCAQDNDYEWFTNHIYLTAVVWTKGGWEIDTKLSFSLTLDVSKVSSLVTTIGTWKEMLEAQARTLTDTLVSVLNVNSLAGRSFPTWKFSARPEIMIDSTNALRYFNRLADRSYQDMQDLGAFRERFKQATTMVDYDAPFGDTATNIPNWITIMNVAGVTSGPLRPYPPPVKFTGNGNTVMYDNDGEPASLVT